MPKDVDVRSGSRVLVAATIAYAALTTVALAALGPGGTLPAATETGPELVTWFQTNGHAVRVAVWAMTIGMPPFAVMVASLCRMMPSPHRDVFFFGALVFAVSTAVWSWTWVGLALHADQLDPAITRTVLDVASFFGPVLTGATTTMMAPVTLLALREGTMPRWLGVLGLVAFVEQSIETITIFGTTGFTQPGGAMNMQLGAGLTLAWILSLGLWGGLRGRDAAS